MILIFEFNKYLLVWFEMESNQNSINHKMRFFDDSSDDDCIDQAIKKRNLEIKTCNGKFVIPN
jgi:hypothetical protein